MARNRGERTEGRKRASNGGEKKRLERRGEKEAVPGK
jgi:hypothetical protein